MSFFSPRLPSIVPVAQQDAVELPLRQENSTGLKAYTFHTTPSSEEEYATNAITFSRVVETAVKAYQEDVLSVKTFKHRHGSHGRNYFQTFSDQVRENVTSEQAQKLSGTQQLYLLLATIRYYLDIAATENKGALGNRYDRLNPHSRHTYLLAKLLEFSPVTEFLGISDASDQLGKLGSPSLKIRQEVRGTVIFALTHKLTELTSQQQSRREPAM